MDCHWLINHQSLVWLINHWFSSLHSWLFIPRIYHDSMICFSHSFSLIYHELFTALSFMLHWLVGIWSFCCRWLVTVLSLFCHWFIVDVYLAALLHIACMIITCMISKQQWWRQWIDWFDHSWMAYAFHGNVHSAITIKAFASSNFQFVM